MSDILCVTNRKLCNEDFMHRLKRVAEAHPSGIILREKDISESEYEQLAVKAAEICSQVGTPLILHTFTDAAKRLGCRSIHLPMHILEQMSDSDRSYFSTLGASCHSVEDAVSAQKLGCTYITAGHIFDTDCKKGLPGRGLEFLSEICRSVDIPVYAIGGIDSGNYREVVNHGAHGACVMSGMMRCDNVNAFLGGFEDEV